MMTANVVSFKLTDDNTIEIVVREPGNMMYACNPPRKAPDSVNKLVYGVVDGKITLLQKIHGQHTPAYMVDERIEFK